MKTMPQKHKHVAINGKSVSFNDLINSPLQENWGGDYDRDTLLFIQSWLRGEKVFPITTSGSTGKPKTITITRDAMEHSARMTARALQLAASDRALACINTRYIGGKMMLVRALTLDMHLTIVSPSSHPLVNLRPGTPIDFIALVPLQLETLLGHADAVAMLNKAKAIIVGGAPVGEPLKQKLQVLKAPVYATYGMTETVSHIALKKLNGTDKDQYFKVFPEVIIGQDKRGCLTIRSIVTGGKKIITNDRVSMINDHEFEWLGRIDNVVNTGGIKVQLEELESKIEDILTGLGRNEPLMVAVKDNLRLGQKLILLLEGRGQKEDELTALLKKQLGYQAPREIKWVPEFSRTRTGKINRHQTTRKYLK